MSVKIAVRSLKAAILANGCSSGQQLELQGPTNITYRNDGQYVQCVAEGRTGGGSFRVRPRMTWYASGGIARELTSRSSSPSTAVSTSAGVVESVAGRRPRDR